MPLDSGVIRLSVAPLLDRPTSSILDRSQSRRRSRTRDASFFASVHPTRRQVAVVGARLSRRDQVAANHHRHLDGCGSMHRRYQPVRSDHPRLDALGPAPRAELLHVLMLPDLGRAERIGEF
jgi:hypothetical protein